MSNIISRHKSLILYSHLQHLAALVYAWMVLIGPTEVYNHPYIGCICVIIAYVMSLYFKLFIPYPIPVIGSVKYFLWLIREILKSTIAVTRIVWQANLSVNPKVISMPLAHISPVKKLLYTHSITLTPGTAVIEVTDKAVLVHVLHFPQNAIEQNMLSSTLLNLQHKVLRVHE